MGRRSARAYLPFACVNQVILLSYAESYSNAASQNVVACRYENGGKERPEAQAGEVRDSSSVVGVGKGGRVAATAGSRRRRRCAARRRRQPREWRRVIRRMREAATCVIRSEISAFSRRRVTRRRH